MQTPDELFYQLRSLPLLRAIDSARWESLRPYIRFRRLVPEEPLFLSGRKSRYLYWILDGTLNLYLPQPQRSTDVLVAQRTHGDTAGDFAVINGTPHLVTARALAHCVVARFPVTAFEKLIGLNPGILAHVYETAASLSRKVLLLRSFLNLFPEISEAALNNLLKLTQIRHIHSGEVLFRQDDVSDGLYIVMAGRLPMLLRAADGETTLLAEARPPQIVGEFSLITGNHRVATVYASRESMVAFLSKEVFQRHIVTNPALMASISRMIVERQSQLSQQAQAETYGNNTAVIVLSSALPLRQIMHALKKELRQFGKVIAIDSSLFDTLYGKAGASQTTFSDTFNSSITAWLDDRENQYEHTLYVADTQWNPWTQRCINRADRLLLLMDMSESHEAQTLERKILQTIDKKRFHPRLEYVFLHPENTEEPVGTEKWLVSRAMDAYHHVRLNDDSHFARLARRVSGHANGLVLSAGGARGYVHLGVHRALEELSIPIDYIGGSSMGGLLGGAMAMGLTSSQIAELSGTFANPKALFDYTLPLASLMKSAKLTAFCKALYRDKRIEDLWTPYFCISSDLSLGVQVCHQRGYLWEAVRCSIAIPGVFTPVPTAGGKLLVDGAVLNGFPVVTMRKLLSGGYLIGVNVAQHRNQIKNYNYGTSLSGWSILKTRMNIFNKSDTTAPRIGETLLRANDIRNKSELIKLRKLVDVLVEPNVNAFALLDFRSYAKISEVGYLSALHSFAEQSHYYKPCNRS